jgi:2-oxoglutarate ferredoxin oxidoreductase subunit alpha
MAREAGLKVGLFRPITVWPFPANKIADIAARKQVKFFISVEMNAGQMLEDVKLAVNGKKPVYFYGRMGGIIPTPMEILTAVKERSRS